MPAKAPQISSVYSPFSAAISKINRCVQDHIKLESNAREVLAVHLYNLSIEIADRASKASSENSPLTYNNVMTVLPEFISGDLHRLAVSEACRNLMLHANGIKTFKPKAIQHTRRNVRVSPQDQIIPAIFANGIKTLVATRFNSGFTLSDKACQKIDHLLSGIATFLVNSVLDVARSQKVHEMDHNFLKTALESIVPKVLMQHGAYYGDNCVAKFKKGGFKYDDSDVQAMSATADATQKPKSIRKRKRSRSKATSRSAKRRATSRSVRKSRKPVSASKTATPRSTSKKISRRKSRKSAKKAAVEPSAAVRRERSTSKTATPRSTSKTRSRRKSAKKSAVKPSAAIRRERSTSKSATPRSTSKKRSRRKSRKSAKKAAVKPSAAVRRERSTSKTATPKTTSKKRSRRKSRKGAKKAAAKSLATVRRGRSTRKRDKSEERKTTKLDFSNDIILSNKFSKHADSSAIQKINSCMMNVCTHLVEKCNKNSALTIEAIRVAIEKVCPPKFAEHALAHAAKALLISSLGEEEGETIKRK